MKRIVFILISKIQLKMKNHIFQPNYSMHEKNLKICYKNNILPFLNFLSKKYSFLFGNDKR